MNRLLATCLLSLPLLAASVAAQAEDAAPETVKVKSRKNPGDLPYKAFFKIQQHLLSYLPPEPRMVDLTLRVYHTELSGAERDTYLDPQWSVAVVGETVDVNLPVARGGYFMLPDLPQARAEGATLMFHTQTKKRYVDTAWVLRTGERKEIAYQDLARAFSDVAAVQGKIGWFELGLLDEKRARYDSLKACFQTQDGAILLDGVAVDAIKRGPCAWLKFDPTLLAANPRISFSGPLQLALLDDSANVRPNAGR